MRKPGEPIYLRIHLIALPQFFVGPLDFGTRAFAGLGIAVAGGIGLYLLYNSSARNEP